MTQQTIFEQFLDALLEGDHDVHFKKENGTICMTLDSQEIVAISGVTLEQIGQLGIGSAVCIAFQMNLSMGAAGKTRIDGAADFCNDPWHSLPDNSNCPTCRAVFVGAPDVCKDAWHDSPDKHNCPTCNEEHVEDLVVEGVK